MSILLEGADNSGKTTLAKELLQLNAQLEHFIAGSPPLNMDHERFCIQQQYALACRPHMILDRATCLSQQIYNDGRLFETGLMVELDKLLQIGTLVVFCRPSTDKLMAYEKFTWRSEESEIHKQRIIANRHLYIERYDQIMQKIPHIVYDYEDELASAWLRKMLSEISSSPITYQRLIDITMQRFR